MDTVLVDTPLQASAPDVAGIPQTLSEALRYYSDPDLATMAFSALHWPDDLEMQIIQEAVFTQGRHYF
jgi:hypothetical protein